MQQSKISWSRIYYYILLAANFPEFIGTRISRKWKIYFFSTETLERFVVVTRDRLIYRRHYALRFSRCIVAADKRRRANISPINFPRTILGRYFLRTVLETGHRRCSLAVKQRIFLLWNWDGFPRHLSWTHTNSFWFLFGLIFNIKREYPHLFHVFKFIWMVHKVFITF